MLRIDKIVSLMACSTAILGAQSTDVRSAWNSISGSWIAAAAKMPESSYAFRPSPDVRSFAELVGHVADAQRMFCGALLPQASPAANPAKPDGKAQVLRSLKDSARLCGAAADRLTDADALQPVKLFGGERAKLSVLWANIAHSSEHYGNAVTYMRMQGVVPPSSDGAVNRIRVHVDQAHGEAGPLPDMTEIGQRVGFHMTVGEQVIRPETLKGVRALYLRTPTKSFAAGEKEAIVQYVKDGGALLLVLDEESRQSLAGTEVNGILAPFGMQLTPDTPYLHNCGGIAKAGEINSEDREIPYSGGRAVEGGTPFAYQLDAEGKPGAAFAAWKRVEGGGRIIVMAEGMVSLFLGVPGATRLSGKPRDAQGTVYWGKDSTKFMEEVMIWLVKR